MEETCIHDYVYWTEFQSKRFYQILPQDFDRQLSIPSKFIENVKELCGTVSLKGPARKTWKVELNKTQDGLFFQNGWSQFVRENCLEAGNLLVFRYSGHLHFDVSIFDHESLCEKACSFFIENSGCHVKRRSRVDYEEVSPAIPPSSILRERSSKKHRSDRVNPPPMLLQPSTQHTRSKAPIAGVGNPCQSSRPVSAKRKFRSEELESSSSEGYASSDELGEDRSSSDEVHEAGETPPGFKYSVREHISGRRPATEEEKKKARLLADESFAASSIKSFLVVMRKSHVYRGFQLTIPYDFALKHFPTKNKFCTLYCEGRRKDVMFKPRQKPDGGKFTKGWADFVLENNIEEDDICLFKLLDPVQKQEEHEIVFNVHIFRAVDEIVPLTCHRTPWPGNSARLSQGGGVFGRGRGRGRGVGVGRGRGRGRGRRGRGRGRGRISL